jgi:iron complex transport system substrate-binding protein
MKQKAKILVLLLIIALVAYLIFALRKNKHPVIIEDLPKKTCSRIVSLAPSITEILFALGLGDKVIGVSEFSNYPPQVNKIPKVGGLLNPNYEAIVAAKPDLVIFFENMPGMADKFDSLKIEALAVKHDSLNEILDSIQIIGRYCGKSQEADKIVSDIQSKINSIQSQITGQNRPKVLISLGHDYSKDSTAKPQNIYIAGDDGFYSEMVRLAGGQNAYEGKLPFPMVNIESIIIMNPQIIIDIAPVETKPTESEITVKQWKNFDLIDAAKNDRIYVFTEDYTAIPGPRFILTLEKIARIINPQLNLQKNEPNSN